MRAKDFRQRAWGKLNGQWGTMALIALIYLLLTSIMGGASVIGVGAVAELILGGPLLMGVIYCSLTVCRNNKVEINQLFSGFNNFVNAMVLYIINTIFIALWSILFVIPGIVKSYSYSMSYYILADNPDMPANDARKASMELMRGNKWRLFCLHLSFIGWFILCCLTFGILTFWVMPYVQTATAEFYQNLVHKDVEPVAHVEAKEAEETKEVGETTEEPAEKSDDTENN
jgi:uncharacterized membrane protein